MSLAYATLPAFWLRGPTTDMCPCGTLKNCGSSSNDVLRTHIAEAIERIQHYVNEMDDTE